MATKYLQKEYFNKPFSSMNVFQKTEAGDPTEKTAKLKRYKTWGSQRGMAGSIRQKQKKKNSQAMPGLDAQSKVVQENPKRLKSKRQCPGSSDVTNHTDASKRMSRKCR